MYFFIFEMYVYYLRDTRILSFTVLKVEVIKLRKIEEEIAKNNSCKTQEFFK